MGEDLSSAQKLKLRGYLKQFHAASTQETALAVCERALRYLLLCPLGHERDIQEGNWKSKKASELEIDPKTYRWFAGKERVRGRPHL